MKGLLSVSVLALIAIFVTTSCSNNEDLIDNVRPCDGAVIDTPAPIWSTKYENSYLFGKTTIRQDDNYIVRHATSSDVFVIIDKVSGELREYAHEECPYNVLENKLYIGSKTGLKVVDLNTLSVLGDFAYENLDVRILDIDIFENKVYILTQFDFINHGYSYFDEIDNKIKPLVRHPFTWYIFDGKLYRNDSNELCAIFLYSENDTDISGLKSINIPKNAIEYSVILPKVGLYYTHTSYDQFTVDGLDRVFLKTYKNGKESYVIDIKTGKILLKKDGWLNPLDENLSVHYFTDRGNYPKGLVETKTGEKYPNIRHDSIVFNVLDPLFVHAKKYYVHTAFGKRTYFVDLETGCVKYYLVSDDFSEVMQLSNSNEICVMDTENNTLKKYLID